jgi:ureidoacrylate peracid hydrolase
VTLYHVPPLRTLKEKLAPTHTALLVVDVLNDFCAPGGTMDQEGLDVSGPRDAAARIPKLLEAARAVGVLPVFVRNVYSTPANHYLSAVWLEQAERRRQGSYTLRPVCPPDSWNNDFYGEIRPQADEPVVTKHRFDAFLNTDLDTILSAHGIRTVVIAGVATNVCVETTVRSAFLRDYYVVVPSDACATFSSEEHEASLRTIDKYFGQVVELDEVVRVWREARTGDSLSQGRLTISSS